MKSRNCTDMVADPVRPGADLICPAAGIRAIAVLLLVCTGVALAAPGPLTVRLVSPAMNASVRPGAAITLAAEVEGDGVGKVEFLDNGKLVATVDHAPFRTTYRPEPRRLNIALVAKATAAQGPTALSPVVTCVVDSPVERRHACFDYEEEAEGMLKQVRLAMPEGLGTVRGILVVSNPHGGDTRDWYKHAWYGEFLHLHGFAFLGTKGFTSHVESLQTMLHGLAKIAGAADHPELVNVPFVVTGFSAGGGYSSRLLVEIPERVIASVPVCSRLKLPDVPKAASLATPACIMSGELESRLPGVIEPVLAAYRPKGALFGWMTVQGTGHAMVGQEVLAMPLLDAAVRLRYPPDGDVRKGPVGLLPLALDSGWVADNTSWHNGLVSIAPAAEFTGDIAQSSWLPNLDTAFIYRAYATYDRPLTIASPSPGWSRNRVWAPGSNVTVVVDDARFADWRKMEFHDGARKLGEIAAGPPQFTATDLGPGFHALSVLGTDGSGKVRTSNPVLVVVRAGADQATTERTGGRAAVDGRTQTKIGVVRNVDQVAKAVVVMVARELTFTITSETEIRNGSSPATLADIRAGQTVEVVYSFGPDRSRIASRVTIPNTSALHPGQSFSVQFPDMPATFAELADPKGIPPQMTVFLPTNYSPSKKFPLLVSLGGGDGGRGGNPGVARGIVQDRDFVCVSLPLFHKIAPGAPGYDMIIRAPDAAYMWPFYKRMLAELDRRVPNLDPACRVIGGFSNGAHAVQEFIDLPEGEAVAMFSGFFLVNGGGRLRQYDRLKNRPLLFAYGDKALRPQRLAEILAAAEAGGTILTAHGMKGVGHAFPASEYPAVRAWLLKASNQTR